MRKPNRPAPNAGFTLVELMVTIVIVVVLASLVFIGARRALESAKSTKNMARVKDLGTLYATYASDYGHYPPGWDGNYGLGPNDQSGRKMNGRGPDLMNAYMAIWEINDRWLSPAVETELVSYNGNSQPTNYSGHPVLCYNGNDQQDPVRQSIVSRPSEVFLLLDGVPKSDDSSLNSQTSIRQWYSIATSGRPANRGRQLPVEPSGGNTNNGPDFRNKGKCHVLFCDGHVEAFGPKDFKQKHVAIRY